MTAARNIYLVHIFLLTAFIIATPSVNAHSNNITIMISLDGFRWDYLDRGLTPNLKQLAETGAKAHSLIPSFPTKTFPNHISLVTGHYPQSHGIINNRFFHPAYKATYQVGDTSSVHDIRWYEREFIWQTVQKQGMQTLSVFWPGSETKQMGSHPSHTLPYQPSMGHEKRIAHIIKLLQGKQPRPQLVLLYFSDTDRFGHLYGPNSKQTNKAIEKLDRSIKHLVQRLDNSGLKSNTNIVVVSDHGMSERYPNGLIDLRSLLKGEHYRLSGMGPVFTITAMPPSKSADIYDKLNLRKKQYQVFKKTEIPKQLHYNKHPAIGDVILVANKGYSFYTTQKEKQALLAYKGDHGYPPNHKDMHGIFIANGPGIKPHSTVKSFENIHIYPLLCHLLEIKPAPGIAGSLKPTTQILTKTP